MDCKETLKNLSLLLDGELEMELEQKVLAHIHDCWHCAEVKENETKLKELIKSKLNYSRTVPGGVASEILKAINGQA
ncbi:hypothetical protein GC194_05660 [bacterium]|nr:hypothetical protein [bacterium]